MQAQAEAIIIDKLSRLSDEIRTPNKYIGQSAFALFALLTGCRPKMWEGENRVDIVETYCGEAPGKEGCLEELRMMACAVILTEDYRNPRLSGSPCQNVCRLTG